jgi:hypothetical protein
MRRLALFRHRGAEARLHALGGTGFSPSFGPLLLGHDGKLIYAGRVGAGMTDPELLAGETALEGWRRALWFICTGCCAKPFNKPLIGG